MVLTPAQTEQVSYINPYLLLTPHPCILNPAVNNIEHTIIVHKH
jgi:hypothetical protein